MFAFEFAILLITSTGILARYTLSLVEKWILHREALSRKAARAAERVARRVRIEEQTRENARRREAGEEEQEVEDELDDDDDEEDELDVGGWEDKGTWVFYTELATGEKPSFKDCLVIGVNRLGVRVGDPLPTNWLTNYPRLP